jgi:tetratricopeptide (TPR) repeat protein
MIRRLQRLPQEDLYLIAQDLNKVVDKFDEFYEIWDGNLWTFTRVTDMRSEKYSSLNRGSEPEIIVERTLALPAISKLVLFLVIAHDGICRLDDVTELCHSEFQTLTSQDIQSAIELLTRHDLCSVSSEFNISISHDTLVDLFNTEKRRELVSSYSLWFKHYKTIISSKNYLQHSKTDAIFAVIDFAVKQRNFSALSGLTSDISDAIGVSLQPRRLLSRIALIFSSIGERDHLLNLDLRDAQISYAKIAYSSRLFEECQMFLGDAVDNAAVARALRVSSMIGDEDLSGAHDQCQVNLESASDRQEKCIFSILGLVITRTTQNRKDARVQFENLISEFHDENLREYGYILRAADYCCEISESVDYLRQSITHFTTHQLSVEVGFSQNALANQMVRLGRLAEAAELYRTALDNINSGNGDHRTVLHNQACMNALTHVDTSAAISILSTILLSQQNKFYRAIVLLNRGAARAQAQEYELAHDDITMAIRLIEAGNVNDVEVISLAHLNLANVEVHLGGASKNIYLPFDPESFGVEESQLWKARLHGIEPSRAELSYLATLDFTPILLSHWLPEFSYL